MRRRRLIVAVIVVVLVGGAISGSLELRSTSDFAAKRPLESAFAKGDSAEAGGRATVGLDGLTELQFIPSAPFPIGIVLTNESAMPVTLDDVRAVLPHDSVLPRSAPLWLRSSRTTALRAVRLPPAAYRRGTTVRFAPARSRSRRGNQLACN